MAFFESHEAWVMAWWQLMKVLLLALCLVMAVACSPHRRPASIRGLPERIAFGSCSHQARSQPILASVVEKSPDLFVYLGDNVYGDTEFMPLLEAKYQQLGVKPEFQDLRRSVAVVATWDDHDYGANDAGKDYPMREESKGVFLKFWGEPLFSARRHRPGIYTHYSFSQRGRRVQVILLDTRTFRDPLLRRKRGDSRFKNDYQPDSDSHKTLLGEAQWAWLEERFREKADLRIIASSIQFSHEYNGWESWTNLPMEQQRMLELVARTRANGVLFISGDVHWGEISRRETGITYPIHDVTSSGLTETWPTLEPNKHRLGEAWRSANFGLLEIDWDKPDPEVAMKILDVDGEVRVSHAVPLSELQFREDEGP